MKTSKSAEIWKTLTPAQRASLLFVGEVDVAEVTDAIEDTEEDEARNDAALRHAGVTGVSDAWWSPKGKGSALVKRGLVKTVPSQSYVREHDYALTPLGKRVVEHAKRLLIAGAAQTSYPPKSAAQLDAEIAEALAEEQA